MRSAVTAKRLPPWLNDKWEDIIAVETLGTRQPAATCTSICADATLFQESRVVEKSNVRKIGHGNCSREGLLSVSGWPSVEAGKGQRRVISGGRGHGGGPLASVDGSDRPVI
jgi:hypothetical protein